jgi:hypothetical protein
MDSPASVVIFGECGSLVVVEGLCLVQVFVTIPQQPVINVGGMGQPTVATQHIKCCSPQTPQSQ